MEHTPSNFPPCVVGTKVQTLWDTGAVGMTTLFGRVVKAGPRIATIEWESGIRNAVKWNDHRIKLSKEQ